MRSERHVATPKTGLPYAPTRGFGAPGFGLACYSRGPFQAAMFLIVFWILFPGHDEVGSSPNTKVFGC